MSGCARSTRSFCSRRLGSVPWISLLLAACTVLLGHRPGDLRHIEARLVREIKRPEKVRK